MSVVSRLQRLTGEKRADGGGPCNGEPSRAEELRALRARIDQLLSRRPDGRPAAPRPAPGRGRGVPLADLVPGVETINDGGAFFCVDRATGGSSRHGRFCIRDLAPLDMTRLAVLANDPALRACDWSRGLFFDTETTGLAGGTGTVAFLIGVGWFDGGGFATRQLFARDYAEERATLVALSELLREKEFLVSFNGKAFDANLLSSRFILNRLLDPLAALPHLDLLHPARRLLGHRVADRRLGTLEATLLGFQREGDIPGSEIPQRYFDWLRNRDGRGMAGVFEHNRLDILSLAALAAQLTELIDPATGPSGRDPGDLLAAARLFLIRDCPLEAVRLLEPLAACGCSRTAREARRELSLLYKRSDRWPDAVQLWEEMIRQDRNDLFALVELAKWCEHRQRDFGRAMELTLSIGAGHLSPDEREGLRRRRERLHRKLVSPDRSD